jgi:hypothetical protein
MLITINGQNTTGKLDIWTAKNWSYDYCLLKCQFTQDLHSTTSQKTAFFIVNGMKTSNLTRKVLSQTTFRRKSTEKKCVNRKQILVSYLPSNSFLFIPLSFSRSTSSIYWRKFYNAFHSKSLGQKILPGEGRFYCMLIKAL